MPMTAAPASPRAAAGPAVPAWTYVDKEGQTHHVRVRKHRRKWQIRDHAAGQRRPRPVDEIVDAPDAFALACGVASDYAHAEDRSDANSATARDVALGETLA